MHVTSHNQSRFSSVLNKICIRFQRSPVHTMINFVQEPLKSVWGGNAIDLYEIWFPPMPKKGSQMLLGQDFHPLCFVLSSIFQAGAEMSQNYSLFLHCPIWWKMSFVFKSALHKRQLPWSCSECVPAGYFINITNTVSFSLLFFFVMCPCNFSPTFLC